MRDNNGVAWLVGANGRRTWSFGVCVVDTGVKFDDYNTVNPAYGAWRYYPSKQAWARDAVGVLKSGGFNTVGAWSDYRALLNAPNNDLMMTPIIHAGSSAGFPWLDMWDPALVKLANDVTKSLIGSLRNDPRVIGYFSDNELGWWKPAIWDWIWKQRTHFERRRVVALLRRRYRGDWKRFGNDFEVVDATGWSQLAARGHPYLRANCHGQAAISTVLGMLAERYYSLCASLVKKYAPHALYLGDRYISNYYPEVARAAGRHCDVVSTNLNPDFTDGSFVSYYLHSLEALTRRPLLVSEFYMCAREGRSGNGNDRSGFPVVDTLAERAAGFAQTTRDLLSDPDVVGAHWFQYYDEPKDGRGDGENYNFGLVDTANRPYAELLATGRALDLARLHAQAKSRVIGSPQIPRAPQSIESLQSWNRRDGLVVSTSSVPRGDLYVAWTPKGLNLGLVWAEERFDAQYFRGAKVPLRACTSIVIACPDTGKRCVVRLMDAGATVHTGFASRVHFTPGTTARCMASIPASALGQPTLAVGAHVNVTVRLVSECHAYTTTWNVKRTLGG